MKAPSVIVLGLIIPFLVSTVLVVGCGSNLQNEYSQAVQTLVNYRNKIVQGTLKPDSKAFHQFVNYVISEQINIQDSGPRNVRVPLTPNSPEMTLLVEKSEVVGLITKAGELETHIPPKGQTNYSLKDFDNAAKNLSKAYHIPIQLTPI